MEIQIGELYPREDSSTLGSNKSSNPASPKVQDEPKQPAKECFKVIYGLGNSAERMRLLAEETKEARRNREQREKEEAAR